MRRWFASLILAVAITNPSQLWFTANGTGAVKRTAASKFSESVSVTDYGATGDGITNDRTAIVNAIAAVTASHGRVYFPQGNYLIGSSFTIPDYVWLEGTGAQSSKLLRGFTGDFITAMGAYSGIDRMGIDGQTTTWGAGIGVHVTAGTSQRIVNSEIRNFVNACLQFEQDAGSLFVSMGTAYYTTGAMGSVGAIKMNGTDSAAASRSFFGVESLGSTLYDFGGCNDCYVYGGYSNGLIFGTTGAHVNIAGMRIGAAGGTVTVKGVQNHIMGCEFAASVILDASTASNQFASGVPSNDVTDNGSGNIVMTQNFSLPSAGQMIVKGIGPHAIGGGTNIDTRLRILGAFTGTTNTFGLGVVDTLTVPANGYGAGATFNVILSKAGSGTHAKMSAVEMTPPTLNGGAATVTDAATLLLRGAPTGATNNDALRIDAGTMSMGGTTQASLGTPRNGTIIYCSDCTIANPCASGGTGAFAKRLNGVWVCN